MKISKESFLRENGIFRENNLILNVETPTVSVTAIKLRNFYRSNDLRQCH